MLMNIKLSKDNQREVHLCYEERKWVQKTFNKGELEEKLILSNEEEAFTAFDNKDIGETY